MKLKMKMKMLLALIVPSDFLNSAKRFLPPNNSLMISVVHLCSNISATTLTGHNVSQGDPAIDFFIMATMISEPGTIV